MASVSALIKGQFTRTSISTRVAITEIIFCSYLQWYRFLLAYQTNSLQVPVAVLQEQWTRKSIFHLTWGMVNTIITDVLNYGTSPFSIDINRSCAQTLVQNALKSLRNFPLISVGCGSGPEIVLSGLDHSLTGWMNIWASFPRPHLSTAGIRLREKYQFCLNLY